MITIPVEVNEATRFLPVAEPVLMGNEKTYVNDCLDSNWISSKGEYIERFEAAFAAFCGVRYGISCMNGTVALHVALLALGVGEGDEVIVPTMTFVASANAVRYCNATPVFADIEPDTWNLDPAGLEALITPRTKGIMAVHIFGLPANMEAIRAIAEKHGLFVLEDAAEAHGATYQGEVVGGIGKIGTFSFYGNKIITAGEGGIVVTDDEDIALTVLQLKGQGQDLKRRYWFPMLGFNYRMTNIQAAIALAQLEQFDWHFNRKQDIAGWYAEGLSAHPAFQLQHTPAGSGHAHWINSIVLTDAFPLERDETMSRLMERNIETRPFFYPMHHLPIYADACRGLSFPVADKVAGRGISLPSGASLTQADVERVCEALIALAEGKAE